MSPCPVVARFMSIFNTEFLKLYKNFEFIGLRGYYFENRQPLHQRLACCPKLFQPSGNTLEGDVSDVIALVQLTSPFSPRKATRMSP